MRVLKADAGITDLAFSPDGRAIAASDERSVYLWNLEAMPPSRVVCESGSDHMPRGGLHFSADGRVVNWLAISWDDSVTNLPCLRRSYHRDTRTLSVERTFAAKSRILRVAYTPNLSQGISLEGMPNYRLWGWRLAEQMWVQSWWISTLDLSVETPTPSADGRLFAMLTRSAGEQGWAYKPRRIEVRDMADAALLGTGEYPYKVEAKRLLFSPDNQQLVGLNAMNLLVWPVATAGNLGTPLRVGNTTRKYFTSMAYHRSGRYLYVTSNGEDGTDATVHVFETSSWARVGQFSWNLGNLKAIALSPDGALAAAGGDRGDLVIWDVDE